MEERSPHLRGCSHKTSRRKGAGYMSAVAPSSAAVRTQAHSLCVFLPVGIFGKHDPTCPGEQTISDIFKVRRERVRKKEKEEGRDGSHKC